MLQVVELEDSDDDNLYTVEQRGAFSRSPIDPLSMSNSSDQTTEPKAAKEKDTRLLVEPKKVAAEPFSVTSPVSLLGEPINKKKEGVSLTQPRARQHRRKSTHQVRSSPEIEFAFFPLDPLEDTDSIDCVNFAPSNQTITKMLSARQPSPEDVFNGEFEKFLNDSQTLTLIIQVAMERFRINTLLTLNGMPEINFSLYTQSDGLRSQLEDRFRRHDL